MNAKQQNIELLAPAGGPEAGYAALQHGADALYLGLQDFSARATADNFTIDELAAMTGYAHREFDTPKRIYVTINTLVQQREIVALVDELVMLDELGIDGVIAQDLGVCHILRNHFPHIPIHASTQMAIHGKAGAQQMAKLGISRVITARELTLGEIEEIAAIPELETEVFIHGAMCYSYSGLCLLSSHLYGASGNRGKCAYVCRESFQSDELPEHAAYPLSMCDLNLSQYIDRLRSIGVRSVKIEGRKKSPLYVAAATSYYRALIDGNRTAEELHKLESDLKTIFCRAETDAFLSARRAPDVVQPTTATHLGDRIGTVERIIQGRGNDPDCIEFQVEQRVLERHDGLQLHDDQLLFGFAAESLFLGGNQPKPVVSVRPGQIALVDLPARHPNIPAGAGVYCISSMAAKRSYRWEPPRPDKLMAHHPIDIELIIDRDSVVAKARTGPVNTEYKLDFKEPPETARNDLAPVFERAFGKLGGTPFVLRSITVANPQSLFLPMSLLNRVRRETVKALTAAMSTHHEDTADEILEKIQCTISDSGDAEHWSIKVDRLGSLDELDANDVDEVVIDITTVEADDLRALPPPLRRKVRLALPIITRTWDEAKLKRKIDRLLADDWRRWGISNLAGLSYLPNTLDIAADWPLYALNAPAIAGLMELGITHVTCSPEDDGRNLNELAKLKLPTTVVVYQDTPLSISEACAMGKGRHCSGLDCPFHHLQLTSKRGDNLIGFTRNCRTVLVNQKPFSLTPHINDLRAAGARRFRADFLWKHYEASELTGLWHMIRNGEEIEGHAANFEGAI